MNPEAGVWVVAMAVIFRINLRLELARQGKQDCPTPLTPNASVEDAGHSKAGDLVSGRLHAGRLRSSRLRSGRVAGSGSVLVLIRCAFGLGFIPNVDIGPRRIDDNGRVAWRRRVRAFNNGGRTRGWSWRRPRLPEE